jgi:hypothetical protein
MFCSNRGLNPGLSERRFLRKEGPGQENFFCGANHRQEEHCAEGWFTEKVGVSTY